MSSLPFASNSSTLMRVPTFVDLDAANVEPPTRGREPASTAARPLVLEFGLPGPSGRESRSVTVRISGVSGPEDMSVECAYNGRETRISFSVPTPAAGVSASAARAALQRGRALDIDARALEVHETPRVARSRRFRPRLPPPSVQREE